MILADIGLLDYAREKHPKLRLHLSVQAAAANPDAIHFYVEQFGVERVVLPRVVTVEEIAAIHREIDLRDRGVRVRRPVRDGGGALLAVRLRHRQSPNMHGVCSPAERHLLQRGGAELRLPPRRLHHQPGAEAARPAAYPTLCKGRFIDRRQGHATSSRIRRASTPPSSLPGLEAAGVTALKIEGRQRSRAYVDAVVKAFRSAVDCLDRGLAIRRRRARRAHRGRRHHRRRLSQDVALRVRT